MKKMKKALALMMAAVFAVSAAGCSTPTTTVGDAGTEAPAADSGDSGEASADSGDSSGVKRFVYSVKSDIATLDGQMSNSVADSTVGYHYPRLCTATCREPRSRRWPPTTPSPMTALFTPSP